MSFCIFFPQPLTQLFLLEALKDGTEMLPGYAWAVTLSVAVGAGAPGRGIFQNSPSPTSAPSSSQFSLESLGRGRVEPQFPHLYHKDENS